MKIASIITVVFIFLALVLRFWIGGTSSASTTAYPVAKSYSMITQEQAGREFNFGKSLTYHTKTRKGKIFFTTNGRTSDRPFNSRFMSHTMTIDPSTLMGTWVAHVDGISQGGDILLVPNAHGFATTSTNLYGPHAGKPPAYGQLVALP